MLTRIRNVNGMVSFVSRFPEQDFDGCGNLARVIWAYLRAELRCRSRFPRLPL